MKCRIAAIFAALTLCLAACGNQPAPEKTGKGLTAEQVKVGFIYVGPVGDEGYSYSHDLGRRELEEKLGVKTQIMENVPEDSSCEAAARALIDQGCNVIYATSYGHGQWLDKVARDFPNCYFGHATGDFQQENLSNYMGRVYEPRYLSGIVAGLNTKSNKIGFVAAMKTAEVVRGINAFALGVRAVNPDATVEVSWTNDWYAPALEKSAALELIGGGCDLIAMNCDSSAPLLAAEEKGVKCIGYDVSTPDAAPNGYLTAPLFHWGVYYTQDVQHIIDGDWKAQSYWKGMESGIVSLDTLTDNCAPGSQEAVDKAQKEILDGSFYVFSGEIRDNEGNVKVKAGEKLTDSDLLKMDWFVEGVIGNTK